MAARRSPSRAPTFASQDSTSSASTSRNAALQGASTAFGRNTSGTSTARAPAKTYSGANGALAAASSVGAGSGSTSPARPALFPQSTGGSVRSGRNDMSPSSGPTTSRLGLPPQPQRAHSRSPSHQAASLATARAPPSSVANQAQPTKRPAVAPKPRRLSEYTKQDGASDGETPTDSTPIAPTTSLVDLFERKAGRPSTSGKRPEPIVIKPSGDLPIKSPKPIRSSSGITSVFQMEIENRDRPPALPTNEAKQTKPDIVENRPPLAPGISNGSGMQDSDGSSAPTTSQKPGSTMPKSLAPDSKQPKQPAKRVPSPSPLRSSTSQAIDIKKPVPRTATTPMELFPTSPSSIHSIPTQFNKLHPRAMTPNLTGDQLANAMVAGSLASSRAPSPKKQQPPVPPPRKSRHHHTFSLSRTPSPAKHGMLQTLRKAASETSDDEDEDMLHPYSKHRKKRLVRKHPNKHHEGDRKRWRDAVSERERKRYEGVWAANKGLYCTLSRDEEVRYRKLPSQKPQALEALQDQVSNLIVRDLWSRSRLPESTLEMVWDLVGADSAGRLGKEEFVVGMWLIDQRLKGRKLPIKVSESVWASVRGLQGIKIRK